MDENSTEFLAVPDQLLDQVIGQDRAVNIARLAASQRRFLFLVGEPGTGKSLLGRAVAELLPAAPGYVISSMPNFENPSSPYILCENPEDYQRRHQTLTEQTKQERFANTYFLAFVALAGLGLCIWLAVRDKSFAYVTSALLVGLLFWQWRLPKAKASRESQPHSPKLLQFHDGTDSPFVDATGCSDGALFGDIRHDPYQSGGSETSPHQLVELGAVHKAHGGVLYIDEIGRLSSRSQVILLSAIQDKSLSITGRQSGSSGRMVCTAPVPCDFVLIAAGNLSDLEKLSPALRSRFLGYGYEVLMQNHIPDTEDNRAALTRFIAQEIVKDGRIPHFSKGAVDEVLSEARRRAQSEGLLTARLRDLGGLVRVAGDLAVRARQKLVTQDHVRDAVSYALTIEEQQSKLL